MEPFSYEVLLRCLVVSCIAPSAGVMGAAGLRGTWTKRAEGRSKHPTKGEKRRQCAMHTDEERGGERNERPVQHGVRRRS